MVGEGVVGGAGAVLFRSLRPDFIETVDLVLYSSLPVHIVPVSKTGLH